MNIDIQIRRATEADSRSVSDMLLAQREEYLKYYRPFNFDEVTLRAKFSAAKNDCYWLMALGNSPVALFMLRGFDDGYEIPSFGVVIAEASSGLGLSALSLSYSVSWCAANQVPQIMLKVHPENLKAKKIYESFGFRQSGVDPNNDNIIMRRALKRRVC